MSGSDMDVFLLFVELFSVFKNLIHHKFICHIRSGVISLCKIKVKNEMLLTRPCTDHDVFTLGVFPSGVVEDKAGVKCHQYKVYLPESAVYPDTVDSSCHEEQDV
jgi:hypothetical protein